MDQEIRNFLIGTWVTTDEYGSDVEYTVTDDEGTLTVKAIDPSDKEHAEIRDVEWDGDLTLTFSTYWPSTGRFSKCKFFLSSPNRVDFTFTYTDHDTLLRKA